MTEQENKQNGTEPVRKRRTLEEWQQIQASGELEAAKKSKGRTRDERRMILDAFIQEFGERNLRYHYFRLPVTSSCCRQPLSNHVVTAVTCLNRDDNIIKVSFSFCSGKDQFCREEGKIIAFDRLKAQDAKWCVNLPFYDDGFISLMCAYNLLRENFPHPFKSYRMMPGMVGLITVR